MLIRNMERGCLLGPERTMFTAGLSVDDAATTVYLLKISTNLIHIGTE